MDSRIESTSAMSVKGLWLKRLSLDALLGNSTLSSLALPIFVDGSSCSRSMLNLAERFGIIRLVRKSFDDGSAIVRSMADLLSGIGFLFLPKLFDPNDRPESGSKSECDDACCCSFAFRRVRNLFILSSRRVVVKATEIKGIGLRTWASSDARISIAFGSTECCPQNGVVPTRPLIFLLCFTAIPYPAQSCLAYQKNGLDVDPGRESVIATRHLAPSTREKWFASNGSCD